MALLTPEQIQEFSRRRLGLQSEADISRRRTEEDYGLTNTRLGEQNIQGQQQVSDQLGSQGLANSGIRINAQGQIEKEYNQSLADLNLQRSRTLEDISGGLARGLADIDYNQSAALAQRNREEQDAIDRRAQQEALARAAAVGPPRYPNPVIALPQQQTQQMDEATLRYLFPQDQSQTFWNWLLSLGPNPLATGAGAAPPQNQGQWYNPGSSVSRRIF